MSPSFIVYGVYMEHYQALVLDDVKLTCKLFESYFQKRYELNPCLYAEDAYEAYHLLKTHSNIQILFLDLELNHIHGIDFYRKLVESGLRKKLFIIVASYNERAAKFLVQQGADALIHKPFQKKEIFETLDIAYKTCGPMSKALKKSRCA
jgi:CheY-like chemotaxis protein